MPPATEKLKAEGLSRASSVSKAPSEGTENNYLKELQKTLRNATKKLNASAKVDAILAEYPDKSLDQLIEEKKINSDQKAQHLRKATLQATAAQAEEQITHYKNFAAQYEERMVAKEAELTRSFADDLETVRANAIADATESAKKAERRRLHTLAKFLCSAAILRRDGEVNTETQAFEAVLFQIYGGSQESVSNMLKVIDGIDEKIISDENTVLEVTYGDVKQACDRIVPTEEGSDTSTETIPASDPTLANAGLTELEDGSFSNAAPETSQADQLAPPAQAIVSDGANDVAEKSAGTSSGSNDSDWVELPRNPAETETGLQATPASADGGLTNGSVGADVASQAVPETGAKKSGGRRRNNNRTRDGQPQRDTQGKREGPKAPREGQASEQAPREGQAQGRGRGGRPRGEGRGRGGRGRGRGAPAGNGAAEAAATTAPKSTE
ncbi:hypothetical protein N7541_008185 [Penicillium brevicompactum]|uniref:YAG7-like dimerisation domain-containing protein n=1 Tax=Penicillium brevicompactum TaxID=5074 RepID=A0A9W9R470_PENBR|nr:hypothetical protein N7541_008185 [Penicillium brevicompactum]